MYSSVFRFLPVRTLVFFVMGIVSAGSTMAGDFHTPQRGSAERKAILDVVRAPVEADLFPKVVFVVDQLRVGEGWAFFSGTPQRPSGAPINYAVTKFAEDVAADMFGGQVAALLRWSDGRWQLRDLSIGHTDVVWATWAQDYGAPRGLFDF